MTNFFNRKKKTVCRLKRMSPQKKICRLRALIMEFSRSPHLLKLNINQAAQIVSKAMSRMLSKKMNLKMNLNEDEHEFQVSINNWFLRI